eukprot:123563_1
MTESTISVEQINSALRRYYQFMGAKYNDQFTIYCEDNGFDDMNYELLSIDNATDCMMIDFDTDIPFRREPSDKIKAVYDLLVKICHDPECDFTEEDNEVKPLQVKLSDWKIKKDDIAHIKALHDDQLTKENTAIWKADFRKDKNILALLAMSHNLNAPFLMYVVDLYHRDRVAVFTRRQKTLSEMEWVNKSKYCRELKSLNSSYVDVVQHGVLSFFHRVCPKLALKASEHQLCIVDSLSAVAQYIRAQVEFVYSITQEKQASCPFQMDGCIVFDNVQKSVQKDEAKHEDDDDDIEDGDDDDDDYDEEQQLNSAALVDVIGDVKYRLKYNQLMHESGAINTLNTDDEKSEAAARIKRRYLDQFGKFKHKLIANRGDTYGSYPRNYRFCSLVDRREKGDEIIFYEPPNDCCRMPNRKGPEVDLWYFDSSKKCILPASDRHNEVNIDSGHSANGALLCVSFHVLSVNEIRAYLYWNGTGLRFFPQDIISILPEFFVENKTNKAFKGSVKGRGIVSAMKPKLRDKQFEAFYKEYGATR